MATHTNVGGLPILRKRFTDLPRLHAGPLEDATVLIDGAHVAKTAVSRLFVQLGATVIEVAPLATHGDGARAVPLLYGKHDSYFYWLQNAGARYNVAVDQRHEAGKKVMEELYARADILITNSTLRVQKDLGYDWAALHARHPHLVAGYLTFAGLTGPFADLPGYHHTALAMSGIALLNSMEGASLGSIPWVDHGAANRLVVGVLAAYIAAMKSGQGMCVETSLLEYAVECMAYHAGIAWTDRLAEQEHVSAKQYDRHLTVPTLFVAKCKYGESVVIGAVMPAQVEKLFKALDFEHLLQDPRFATADARRLNAHPLLAMFHAKTRYLSGPELVELIKTKTRGTVPVALCEDIATVKQNPHLIDRGMVWDDVEGPDGLPMTTPGFALRVGDYPHNRARARKWGEDTGTVLNCLGYSASDVSAMRDQKVIIMPD